ncbi:hypothetical protein HMPREF1548_01163 [Clostridium sp. KLE 1755]|nr:hypothetical protein HMPREF1548_01163 [Clostridium sp. KLE 1755]
MSIEKREIFYKKPVCQAGWESRKKLPGITSRQPARRARLYI